MSLPHNVDVEMTVPGGGSRFGFRVPVCGFWVPGFCNASLFKAGSNPELITRTHVFAGLDVEENRFSDTAASCCRFSSLRIFALVKSYLCIFGALYVFTSS